MSHFTVLVFGDNYEDQLEPFWELDLSLEELKKDPRAIFKSKGNREFFEKEYEEFVCKNPDDRYENFEDWMGYGFDKDSDSYGYYSNPDARWDWYSVGGRWSGFFKLKEGKTGVVGVPGVFDNKPREGYVDQAIKGDIDFEGMRNDAVERASEDYDNFHKILNGRVLPIWKNIRESHTDIDKARQEYNNNSVIKDLYNAKYHFDFEQYAVPKEEYLKTSRDGAVVTYAIIYKGKWYERGEMGWFGCAKDEKDEDSWNEEFNKILDKVSDNTLLTLIDAHI